MKTPWVVVALLATSAPVRGQTVPAPVTPPVAMPPVAMPPAPLGPAPTPQIPNDLNLLTGKKVIVGRLPLCVPKTYSTNLTYSGKTATVVSFKPNMLMARYGNAANRLPPNLRATMDDAKRGGTITLRFEDGTVLDTCVDMTLSQIAPNLELAPGQVIAVPAAVARASPVGGPEECPLVVAKLSSGYSFGHIVADVLTSSRLERQIDEAQNGEKNYLDLNVQNESKKPIRAFEYTAVYRNTMGDETVSPTYISQNTKPIAPGEVFKSTAMDRFQRSQNGRGDVKVYISRIRFDDDSMWEDNGSRSCFKTVASK